MKNKTIKIEADEFVACFMAKTQNTSVLFADLDHFYYFAKMNLPANHIITYSIRNRDFIGNSAYKLFIIRKNKVKLQQYLEIVDLKATILDNMDEYSKTELYKVLNEYIETLNTTL